MQTVIPVEDVSGGAGGGASWQQYYDSSTPTAPLSSWQSSVSQPAGQGDSGMALVAAAIIVGLALVLGSGRR